MSKSRLQSKLQLSAALVAAASLQACATQTQTPATNLPPVNTACVAFQPIQFSRLHDTEETIVQVKAYNAAWEALCKKP